MSSSKNHQFIEFDEQIVERWVKTVPHMVSGKRVNPHKPTEYIDWVLKTNSANFNYSAYSKQKPFAEKVTFEYRDEVLELYSEQEQKVFKRINRNLIERGLLKLYHGQEGSVNTNNVLSDEEIQELINLPTLPAFKKRLQLITSTITLDRIKQALIDGDKSVKWVSAVTEHSASL